MYFLNVLIFKKKKTERLWEKYQECASTKIGKYDLMIIFPSFFQLIDTKSTDKKQTLLHYIVNVLERYYPDVQHFYQELRYVDRASKGMTR